MRVHRGARWGGGGVERVAAAASASRRQGRMAADGDQAGGVCWPAHQRMTRLGCGGGAAPAPPAAASRLLVMPSRSRRAAAPPRSSSARSSALLRAPLGWSVAFTRTCLIVRCTFLLVRDLPRSGFCAAVVVAAAVRAAAPHLRHTRQRCRQPRGRCVAHSSASACRPKNSRGPHRAALSTARPRAVARGEDLFGEHHGGGPRLHGAVSNTQPPERRQILYNL